MSKKIPKIVIGIVIVLAVLAVVRLFASEDTWLCSDGQWTRHGNPSDPMPTSGCGEEAVSLANPASTYCVEQGGDLKIETRPDGGEFGVCYFMDNYQCEEWAMFRGECPVGGLKVTGYITPSGRFCAITGGEYKITVQGGVETEKGNCTLLNGAICSADDYLIGNCPAIE